MNAVSSIRFASRGIRKLLQPAQLRRTRKIYAFTILLGLADIIGLGSMVPVLMLAIDHSFLEKSKKLRYLFSNLGFTSEAAFLQALIVVIVLFFVTKILLAIWLQHYIRKTATDISSKLASRSFDASFRQNDYEKISADGLGFNDAVLFTPYYFVSGIYIPFINVITESAVAVMLILIFTIYNPAIFFLIVGLLGTTFFLVNQYTRKRITDLGEKSAKGREQSIRQLDFGISGFTDIRNHGVESYFKKRFLFAFQDFVVNGVKALNYQLIPARINEFVSLTGIVVLVIYAYFFSGDNLGQVRVLAALFVISVFRLIPAANRILQALMHLKMNAYTIEKMTALLGKDDVPAPQISTFEKTVSLKDFSFAYPGKLQHPVFLHANFELGKGTVTGIAGISGTGKTTLSRLLMGYYTPDAGQLYIDEKPFPSGGNLSGLYSYMGQDPYIVNGTISDNIALGVEPEERVESQIRNCIDRAALKIPGQENIMDLMVGESGARLSEGQKQRLILARELYRNAEIFILDEPTSSLDEETEKAIIHTLQTLKESGKTMLIIAHRERIFEICDHLFQIKDHKLLKIR